jgi:RNA polymerase sigma-70 factor (ECF subfamily)
MSRFSWGPCGVTTETDDLGALFSRVAAGDKSALKSVHEQMAGRVFGVALAILRDRAAAADVLQETFLKLWQRAGQFDPSRGSPAGWLLTIARYAALDAARARGREVASDDPGLGDTPVDPEALDLILQSEDNARLRACLDKLGAAYRRGIVLAFVHGLSHIEVAEHLVLPLGTVKSNIRRGLLSLRECMA